jgi:DNA-binding IclR family transcriptional regulator
MLENAVQLLRCFDAKCTALTAAEAATMLGLPKAHASRLIDEMRVAGLLERVGSSPRHRPGRMTLDLAAAFRLSSPLMTKAAESVAEIARSCGYTGFVTVLDGADATAVFVIPGTNPGSLLPRVSRMPAARCASGRTMLARLPETVLRALHPDFDDAAFGALVSRLDMLRDEGYEVSRLETQPTAQSVAVAVADPSSGDLVSLCIKFPAEGLSRETRDGIIGGLLEAAQMLARQTGDRGLAVSMPQPARA